MVAERGRCGEGRELAIAILTFEPQNKKVCLMFSSCAAAEGDWEVARRALERTLSLANKQGRGAVALRLEHARVLGHLGELDAARSRLQEVLTLTPPESPLARVARQSLEVLDAAGAGAPTESGR